MPYFGESLVNQSASTNNPRRVAFYVRTVCRSGRLNPGTFYEMTNKEGEFWLVDKGSFDTCPAAPPVMKEKGR